MAGEWWWKYVPEMKAFLNDITVTSRTYELVAAYIQPRLAALGCNPKRVDRTSREWAVEMVYSVVDMADPKRQTGHEYELFMYTYNLIKEKHNGG